MSRRKPPRASSASSPQTPAGPAAPGDPAAAAAIAADRVCGTERALLAGAVTVGVWLRLAHAGRMAVEHFDEGVYASNLLFEPRTGYPNQHLYAPPLLPMLIETSEIAFGHGGLAAMIPSLVAGGLTPLLVWWLTRLWFGQRAAAAAALLAATSEVHIALTRSALTDPLLLAAVLLALALATKGWLAPRGALVSGALAWGALAGLVSGLALWTKYNGWLPIAIVGAGLVIAGQIDRRRCRVSRETAVVLAMAGVAAAVWLPWIAALQPLGGYAAVSANHRGYLSGPAEWPSQLLAQFSNAVTFTGPVTGLGVATALVLALPRPPRFARNSLGAGIVVAAGAIVCGFAMPSLLVAAMLLLALAGLVAQAYRVSRETPDGQVVTSAAEMRPVDSAPACGLSVSRETAGQRPVVMLVVWIAGLLLALAAYRPYIRLVLPLLAAVWLALGVAVARLADWLARPAPSASWPPSRPALLAAALLLGAAIMASAVRPATPWADRTSTRSAAHQLAAVLEADLRSAARTAPAVVVYVFGEPAVFYHWPRTPDRFVVPVGDLGFATPGARRSPVAAYLVVGPQALQTSGFDSQFAVAQPRLTLLAEESVVSSPLVWLDRRGDRHESRFVLYRVD